MVLHGGVRGLYSGVSATVIWRLLLAPFLLSFMDLAVTLYFQPSDYWQGDRSVVVEGNPIARWALSIHPLWLIPGFIGWYALMFPLLFKAPAWFGLRVHVFLVLGHLTMVCGWLIRNSVEGVIAGTLSLSGWLFFPLRRQWESREPVNVP